MTFVDASSFPTGGGIDNAGLDPSRMSTAQLIEYYESLNWYGSSETARTELEELIEQRLDEERGPVLRGSGPQFELNDPERSGGPVMPGFTGPGASGFTRTATADPGGGLRGEDVIDSLRGLDEQERAVLALEMFLSVPGAYADIDDVFMEDGALNELAWVEAVGATLQMAETFGPEGIIDNPLYIDLLMRDTDRDPGELMTLFQQRIEQKRQANAPKLPPIQYLDPAMLADAAKTAFSEKTGRTATKAEQQAFVKKIHGMQSRRQDVSPSAQAGVFAENASPVEADAMKYAGAAQTILNVLGIAG